MSANEWGRPVDKKKREHESGMMSHCWYAHTGTISLTAVLFHFGGLYDTTGLKELFPEL